MKKYYEILGLNEDATLEEVNDSFTRLSAMLYNARKNGEISRADYATRFDELENARDMIISAAKKNAEEAALVAEIERNVKRQAEEAEKKAKEEAELKAKEEAEKKAKEEGTKENTGTTKATETKTVVKQSKVEKETGAKKSGKGWKIVAAVLAALLIIGAVKGCQDEKAKNGGTGAYVTGRPAVTETIGETKNDLETTFTQPESTPSATETPSQQETQETQETTEDYTNRQVVVDLGNVEDDTLVRARAQELVDQMNKAGVVNPVTTVPYTVDEVFALIKYANGVYTPSSMEEIDVLHLNLLNLMISPLNTDDYLYHVVFASGNDDFNALLNPNPTNVGFAEAFAAYGENGVYPLVQWFQQKRFEIYSSTDREEINRIYREVGQVMADLMKGNGCTITLYDGKDAKEGIEYHFTSEQVLANHSSAMIITTEFQLIMANHYEIRNEKQEIVDQVPQTWEVYNKLNSDGVDENGQPIIHPDIVTYDEMNAWVNNGCDYEWAIDSVLINGQTFGQRIQGDMEGMAQNNYAMQHGGQTLGK